MLRTRISHNQAGFSALESLLLLIIACVVVFTGFYVWHANKNTNSTYAAASKAATDKPVSKEPVVTKTYTSNYAGASFSYTTDWTKSRYYNHQQYKQDGVTLTSPSGKVQISWTANIIGIGSPGCSTDVAPGAAVSTGEVGCPAWKNIEVTPLPYGHQLSMVTGYMTSDNKRYEPYIAIQAPDSPLMEVTRGGFIDLYVYNEYRSSFGLRSLNHFTSPEAAEKYLQNDTEVQTAKKIISSLRYN